MARYSHLGSGLEGRSLLLSIRARQWTACMDAYKGKSVEELRWEDRQALRFGCNTPWTPPPCFPYNVFSADCSNFWSSLWAKQQPPAPPGNAQPAPFPLPSPLRTGAESSIRIEVSASEGALIEVRPDGSVRIEVGIAGQTRQMHEIKAGSSVSLKLLPCQLGQQQGSKQLGAGAAQAASSSGGFGSALSQPRSSEGNASFGADGLFGAKPATMFPSAARRQARQETTGDGKTGAAFNFNFGAAPTQSDWNTPTAPFFGSSSGAAGSNSSAAAATAFGITSSTPLSGSSNTVPATSPAAVPATTPHFVGSTDAAVLTPAAPSTIIPFIGFASSAAASTPIASTTTAPLVGSSTGATLFGPADPATTPLFGSSTGAVTESATAPSATTPPFGGDTGAAAFNLTAGTPTTPVGASNGATTASPAAAPATTPLFGSGSGAAASVTTASTITNPLFGYSTIAAASSPSAAPATASLFGSFGGAGSMSWPSTAAPATKLALDSSNAGVKRPADAPATTTAFGSSSSAAATSPTAAPASDNTPAAPSNGQSKTAAGLTANFG